MFKGSSSMKSSFIASSAASFPSCDCFLLHYCPDEMSDKRVTCIGLKRRNLPLETAHLHSNCNSFFVASVTTISIIKYGPGELTDTRFLRAETLSLSMEASKLACGWCNDFTFSI